VYKTDAAAGPVVTSLCGVTAPRGTAWTCSTDGMECKTVGNVTLSQDVTIEWKTEKTAGK
jgi:hypothetical protein